MLAKKFRLPSYTILSVIKKGKKQNYNFFTLSFLSSENPLPQISVIVSNKIDKRSTTRNKIKRRLKEAIQKNLDKFKGRKAIFFAKKEILSAKFSEILNEINKINFNEKNTS